jgi:hypothetical protein
MAQEPIVIFHQIMNAKTPGKAWIVGIIAQGFVLG